MTTSSYISKLSKLGFFFDEVSSTSTSKVFYFSFDGYSAERITFSSFAEALRFATLA